MTKSFSGKVLVVTGAARGIGAGVARAYVARGGKVALLGLEPERLAALADELGPAAAWWEADARDGDATSGLRITLMLMLWRRKGRRSFRNRKRLWTRLKIQSF